MNLKACFVTLSRKDVNADERTVSGWVTTPDPDFGGDVVIPEGVDFSQYRKFNSFTLFHDGRQPIGECLNMKCHPGKGIWALFAIAKHSGGNEALAMIRGGAINAFSTESKDVECGPPSGAERMTYGVECRSVWRRSLLVGVSAVPQPMNPNALITQKSMEAAASLIRDGAISKQWAGRFGLDVPKPVYSIPFEAPKRLRLDVITGSLCSA